MAPHAFQIMRHEAYSMTKPKMNLTHDSDSLRLNLDPPQAPATKVMHRTAAYAQ